MKTFHTLVEPTLFQITRVEPSSIDQFIAELQHGLNEHLEKKHLLETPTLTDVLIED